MAIIYHVTGAAEWQTALKKGRYEAASLAEEGFIHCSQEEQVTGVLERYFKNRKDLVRLAIDTDKLTSPFYYEWSQSVEDTFPHIYGPINLDAVREVTPV